MAMWAEGYTDRDIGGWPCDGTANSTSLEGRRVDRRQRQDRWGLRREDPTKSHRDRGVTLTLDLFVSHASLFGHRRRVTLWRLERHPDGSVFPRWT